MVRISFPASCKNRHEEIAINKSGYQQNVSLQMSKAKMVGSVIQVVWEKHLFRVKVVPLMMNLNPSVSWKWTKSMEALLGKN